MSELASARCSMARALIVAEISANHLGSLDRALQLVTVASKAGADAVKFQTFTPEQMVDERLVFEIGPWEGRRAIDVYREAHTPREWHKRLFDRARELGMTPFSSVFHPDDVAFLETLDCPIYKVSSFELTDHKLLAAAGDTGKPVVISTGMATWEEIKYAAAMIGAEDLTILKCTSAYPRRRERREPARDGVPRSSARLHSLRTLRPHPWHRGSGGRGSAGRIDDREAPHATPLRRRSRRSVQHGTRGIRAARDRVPARPSCDRRGKVRPYRVRTSPCCTAATFWR